MADSKPQDRRRFSLVRISRGLYLLPDNNEQRVWAVYAYDEDGTLSAGDSGKVILGTFWGFGQVTDPAVVSRDANGRVVACDREAARNLSFGIYGWLSTYADGFKTRAAALAAIPHGEPPT